MFKNDNGIWTETVIIQPDDLTAGAEFGRAISMSGNFMAVSAPRYIGISPIDGSDVLNKGKVYLYQNINDEWVVIGEFTTDFDSTDTFFGMSIDITNQFMVISSERSDFNINTSEGRVYLYRAINNIWSFETVLGANFDINDKFGRSVAIDNNTLLVSAPDTDVNGVLSAGVVLSLIHI